MARRPTTIDRLPHEIRDKINALRDQGCTIDEIMTKLGELDIERLPSRSAVGRYIQRGEEIAKELRISRETAEAIVRNLGDAEPDKTTRLNIELMQSIMFDNLFEIKKAVGKEGGAAEFDAMKAMYLSKALDHLGKAGLSDVRRADAIDERIAKRERAKAIKTATALSKRHGLPKDFIKEFRSALEIEQPEAPSTSRSKTS